MLDLPQMLTIFFLKAVMPNALIPIKPIIVDGYGTVAVSLTISKETDQEEPSPC